MESGNKPDFKIIRCPRSLRKNAPKPLANPIRPVQLIVYKDLLNGYCFKAKVDCDGAKYCPGAVLLLSSLTDNILTLVKSAA